jgi:hypothetical protein
MTRTIETQNHEIVLLSDAELDQVTAAGSSPGVKDILVGIGEAEYAAEGYVADGLTSLWNGAVNTVHKAAQAVADATKPKN